MPATAQIFHRVSLLPNLDACHVAGVDKCLERTLSITLATSFGENIIQAEKVEMTTLRGRFLSMIDVLWQCESSLQNI
jgi:hypothetical protein